MITLRRLFILFIAVYATLFISSFTLLKHSPQDDIQSKLSMTKNLHVKDNLAEIFNQLHADNLANKHKTIDDDASKLQDQIENLKDQIKQLREDKLKLEEENKKKVVVKKAPIQKKKTITTTTSPKLTAVTDNNALDLLGAYPELTFFYETKMRLNKTHFGLINEDDYCARVDAYNLANPDNMFKKMNFFTDYPVKALPRFQVMRKMGNILNQEIHSAMPEWEADSRRYHLDTKITNFFTNFGKGPFDMYHKIGQHFACPTQMYNHIPGHQALIRKDMLLDSVDSYVKRFEGRPQCFNKETYFPKFFRLYDKNECVSFFEMLNSQAYNDSLIQEPIQFLVKIGRGSHKGQGVYLLDKEQTQVLNKDYNFGQKCGSLNKSLLVQGYITNPLLLDMNNKFDFRLYIVIASTNPLIVYYHDGFLRVALSEFNKTSQDKATHLTNTFLANQKIEAAKEKKQKINGMTEKQLLDYHLWTFEELQTYLLKSGKISDPKWLDNYLRPAFQKAIIHIIKMTSEGFMKQSNLYELHGMDFILDNNMKLSFIESNPSPLLTGTSIHRMYHQVVKDMFEVQFAYYKSRMSRILKLVTRMKAESAKKTGIADFESWQAEYKEAEKNKLEPAYKIGKKNSFVLIMDENLPAEKAYFGHISKECLPN